MKKMTFKLYLKHHPVSTFGAPAMFIMCAVAGSALVGLAMGVFVWAAAFIVEVCVFVAIDRKPEFRYDPDGPSTMWLLTGIKDPQTIRYFERKRKRD